MTYTLAIHNTTSCGWKLPFSRTELRHVFARMAEAAGLDAATAELTIVGDAAMECLQKETLNCTGPTNILSFPAGGALESDTHLALSPLPSQGDSARRDDFLGWMALSPDTLLRECFLYGQDTEEHCVRLLAHGIVHLLGYDHGDEMDALTLLLETATEKSFSENT